MELDRDLASIQEVRNLVAAAKKAQAQLALLDQRQIDAIVLHRFADQVEGVGPHEWIAVLDQGVGVEKKAVGAVVLRQGFAEIKALLIDDGLFAAVKDDGGDALGAAV